MAITTSTKYHLRLLEQEFWYTTNQHNEGVGSITGPKDGIVRLIPKHIPIPEVNIDDYLRAGIQELIHLLRHKNNKIPDTKTNVARYALIKLTQIVQRDSCEFSDPTFLPKDIPSTLLLQKIHTHPQVTTSKGAKEKLPVKLPVVLQVWLVDNNIKWLK